MKDIIENLKKLVENPDQIEHIPQVIAQLEEMSTTHTDQETAYQERINSLQQVNRNLLSQVPIPGNEPPEPEEKQPTLEDAQDYLIKTLGGNQ